MGYFRGDATPRVFTAYQYLKIDRTPDKANRINGVEVTLTQDDNVVLTGQLRAAYLTVTSGAAACSEMKALECKVRATGANISDAKVIGLSLDCKTKTIATGRGIEVSIDGQAGGAFTAVQGIRIANNSSSSNTEVIGLEIGGPAAFDAHIRFGIVQALETAVEGDLWWDHAQTRFEYYDGSGVKYIAGT